MFQSTEIPFGKRTYLGLLKLNISGAALLQLFTTMWYLCDRVSYINVASV